MKSKSQVFLFLVCFYVVFPNKAICEFRDKFEESLQIKRLPSGHIYSHFEFTIKDSALSNDTRLFPRVLAEILEAHRIQELHFSLTQGYWRLESWGEPVRASPSGAHVTAWFTDINQETADKNWNGFTSRLSGLTCASLNFLDVKTSIVPRFAYRPKGKINIPSSSQEKVFVRVGNLPRENVCTENLTPWSKLLPCGVSRGLASLLRSKQVFNTHFHSEGIHVTQTDNEIVVKLTVSLVLDPPTKLKPTDNLPKRVLGSLAIFPCHPSSKTTVQVWKENSWKSFNGNINGMKIEDVPPTGEDDQNLVFTPIKYMGGYGQEYGNMIIEMTNHLERDLPVLYVEVLPWYIRPYLHTMTFDVKPETPHVPFTPGKILHYTPGQDRKALHKLEMQILIPSKSTVTLSFTVEKGNLKWNEYPPDANHGFYLEAAHFEVNDTKSSDDGPNYYYSRILLVNLSTPDFSMPYNVICLTCTVVALAFGPIHNITTKELKLTVITSKSDKIKEIGRKFLQKFRKSKVDEDKSVAETAADETNELDKNLDLGEDKCSEKGTKLE